MKANRNHHQQHIQNYNQLQFQVSVDANGDCHVPIYQLTGHCIRFQDCTTAVKAWHERYIPPITCYFPNPYEHFVCCPFLKLPLITLPPEELPRFNENLEQNQSEQGK